MRINRRTALKGGLATAAGLAIPTTGFGATTSQRPIKRAIPSSGELLPIVGLGSWITFNVGDDPKLLDRSTRVIKAFVDGGGAMIDSSPMYGSSQATIGYALNKLGNAKKVFSADKVWTSWPTSGPEQIEQTRAHWGIDAFSLLQIHNLVAWQGHLETLRAMKADGRTRYIGITTSHGRRHDLFARIMESEQIDFVQLTYNVLDHEVEDRILPLAKERGIAVIVNRPYRRGDLISTFQSKPLPAWAGEFEAKSWAQFLLKFVLSHPAVTCAIPATTREDHVLENLQSGAGPMPDAAIRKKMIDYVRAI